MNAAQLTVRMVVALTALLLTACSRTASDQSLERITKEQVIRIGYAVEAPHAFLKTGGEVTGEEPEIARKIVQLAGLGKIEWRQHDFGGLIGELEAGRIDAIAAGMFITAERAKRVLFSEPTIRVVPGMMVRKGNPHQIFSYGDALGKAGFRIAVLIGSVEETVLTKMGASADKLIKVPDALTGRVAVESGSADGLALSTPSLRWMIQQDGQGKTELAEPFEPGSGAHGAKVNFTGFAFRKEDRKLRDAWNRAQQQYINSNEHLANIKQFGFGSADLPGSVTAEQVIATQ